MRKNPNPSWLKKRITTGPGFNFTRSVLRRYNINTVCESARCPNIFDCFSKNIATFLILGSTCTRGCRFCSVKKGRPDKNVNKDEPALIAKTARRMKLRHIVVTSVTRDDLPDGGSGHFLDTVNKIRGVFKKGATIEVLVPDFNGVAEQVRAVAEAPLDIFGHNIETIPELYKTIRPYAIYERSLEVLRYAKKINPGALTKSAIMLGLGEKKEEVLSAMKDLKSAGCDIIAIGQYLRPSQKQVKVKRFVHPDEFAEFREAGCSMGFKHVNSGAFVRSSYQGGYNG